MSHNNEKALHCILIELAKLDTKLDALKEDVEGFKKLEDRVESLETSRSYIKGMAAVGVAALGTLVAAGVEIIKRLVS